MTQELSRVVYVAGIHGSGKSTLIRDLAARNLGFIPYEGNHHLELDDAFQRWIWRVTKYWIEVLEQIKLSKENPDSIVLANRCIYDNLGYGLGFVQLGWINSDSWEQHFDLYKNLFTSRQDIRPRNIVHVHPPLEFVKECLRKRWKTHPKKWREDDLKYLEIVHGALEKYYGKHCSVETNVLHLEETDREKRAARVEEWMSQSKII